MCCKFQPEFWTLILGDVYVYIYIKSPRGKNRRETTCGKLVPSNQELLDRNELAAEDLKRGSELLPPQIMVDEKKGGNWCRFDSLGEVATRILFKNFGN